MTKRVAAIDCGTNSIRLLIADVHQRTGKTEDVVREMRVNGKPASWQNRELSIRELPADVVVER